MPSLLWLVLVWSGFQSMYPRTDQTRTQKIGRERWVSSNENREEEP